MNVISKPRLPSLDDSAPSVVISMDFELRWGVHDRLGSNMDAYRENLENVRDVVPALLKLFNQRKIRVTWACVGALGCSNWDEYFSRAPKPPDYHRQFLKFDPHYAELDPDGRLHFAPECLQLINQCPGQDMGTHTFSHIYACEQGVTSQDIYSDLVAVNSIWQEKLNKQPISLVFPRNEHAFLPVIEAAGVRIWRGNEVPWYYSGTLANSSLRYALSKPFRFKDAINPFTKYADHLHGNMTRSSLFLRTNLSDILWKLHFCRIKREIESLRTGEIFHIWCHPHNLGADMDKRLARMQDVLDLIADKCRRGAVVSKNMSDLVAKS